jgi:hypothetical protein
MLKPFQIKLIGTSLGVLLAIFVGQITAFGQTIEWGNPQKIKTKNLFTQIIGETSNGLFVLRCKNGEFSSDLIIEKYKGNLNQELSLSMPLSVNGLVERVLLINNELFVFMSAKNISTNSIDILSQKLDENLKLVGSPVVICSFPVAVYLEKRKIQIKTNAAKTMLGIMFLSKSTDGNGCKLNVYAYQGASQQIFGRQFNIESAHKDVFLTAFDLDNDGNAFILLDFPKKVEGESLDNRAFYFYAYYHDQDKMYAYDLASKDMFIEELGFTVNNFNKSISVFGFYSSAEGKDVNGYFYQRYSTISKETLVRYQTLVQPEILEKLIPGKGEKYALGLNNFYIRKLIPRSDGGIFMAAEKYTRVEQRYNYYLNNMPMEGVRVIYNYDDVALWSINADGTIHFTDVVRKKQSAVGDIGNAGISIVPTQDFIHILYNSELDKDGNVMLHSVNYQGRVEEKILIKNTNFNISLVPSEFRQVAANSLVAATIKDKLFTLVRIKF